MLVLDVDGVITDGTVLVFGTGDEARAVHFHDVDAVHRVRAIGLEIAIVSGEDAPSSKQIAARFGVTECAWGAKDKLAGLQAIADRLGVPLEATCYVGDADRDAPALEAAAIGVAPADATRWARQAADHVLDVNGGRGAVAAAVQLLERLGALPDGVER